MSLNKLLSDIHKRKVCVYMSWYVLQCRPGTEKIMVNSLKQHLSRTVLEDAFFFQSARLYRIGGRWKPIVKDLFPGYVFMESSSPIELSERLQEYRMFTHILEEDKYLISVYQKEEEYLRMLCGESHFLELSYGYKDRTEDRSYIISGPLRGMEARVRKFDWHRRFAKLEISIGKNTATVWAGLELSGKIDKR